MEKYEHKGVTWAPGGHARYWLQSVCGGSRPDPAELFFALKQKENWLEWIGQKGKNSTETSLEMLLGLLCSLVLVGTRMDSEFVYFGEGEICL